MKLHEVLDPNIKGVPQRVIVWSNGDDCIVTWNKSLTFSIW